ELAAVTGLARSTIALRVDALIELGLVSPVADAMSTGGRPSSRFALNPGAKVVLAADLGASHATLAITDLTGTMLAQERGALDIADGPEKVLSWVVDTGSRLLASIGRDRGELIAVGTGLPGPVQHST